jgi:hypothetical protein
MMMSKLPASLVLIFAHLVFTFIFLATGPFTNIKGLTYYKDNDEDPYITIKDVCLSP